MVASALGFSRWGRRLVDRLPGPWWVQAVLAVLLVGLAGRLATLPFAVASYRHRLGYGLTTRSAAGFAADVVWGELVGAVGTSTGVLVLLAVARRWRRAWTAVAGLLMAHELAHARHGDVLVGTALEALGALAGVGLLGLLVGSPLNHAGAGAGDAAVVPFVLAALALGSVLSSPIQAGISRRIETQADVDALAATGDPDAFVEMQRTLALRSIADPTPPEWSQWWWGESFDDAAASGAN